jgi:hypothetical protein
MAFILCYGPGGMSGNLAVRAVILHFLLYCLSAANGKELLQIQGEALLLSSANRAQKVASIYSDAGIIIRQGTKYAQAY